MKCQDHFKGELCHEMFDNFWHPLPTIDTLFSYEASEMLSQNPWYTLPLGPWRHLWMDPLINLLIQCTPLYRITLGQHKSDNNNRMFELTDIFWVLLRYNGLIHIWLLYAADSIIHDPIKRQALHSQNTFIFTTGNQ